jgi:opacity protein-like surface antigen
VFSLIAALAISAPLAAQMAGGGIGIKGGLSYGDVSNSGVFPGGARTRAGVAIGIALLSGGPLGVGIEALYAQRGIVGSSGNSRELDYIDVPVYVQVGATVPEIQPFAYLGPQVSVELKCDADGGSCPSGRDKWSYAGVVGAGLRFQRAAGLSLEARYVYGLSDLKLGTVTDSENYQTRSFMVLLGVGF